MAPAVFIWHRGVFQYGVGKIWVAPVVVGILGGRVPGVLQWIEESLGIIAFPVVGLPYTYHDIDIPASEMSYS